MLDVPLWCFISHNNENFGQSMSIFQLLIDPNCYQVTALSIAHLIACAGFFLLGGFVLFRESFSSFGRVYFIFCIACLVWQLARFGLASSLSKDVALMYAHIGYTASCVVIPAIFHVILVGLQKQREHIDLIATSWALGLIAAPLVLLTPWWVKDVVEYSWGFEPIWGAAGYSFLGVTALLITQILLLIPRSLKGLPTYSNDFKRRQQISMWAVILVFSGADYIPSMGYVIPPLSTLFISLFAIGVARVVFKYGWIDVDADLKISELLKNAQQASSLIDRDGLIKYANPALEKLFDRRFSQLENTRLETLLGSDATIENIAYNANVKLSQTISLPNAQLGSDSKQLIMESQFLDKKKQSFLVQISAIENQHLAPANAASSGFFDELSQLPTYNSFKKLAIAICERQDLSVGPIAIHFKHYKHCLINNGYASLETLTRQRRNQISEAFPESVLTGHVQNDIIVLLLPFTLLQDLPTVESRISTLGDLNLDGADSSLGELCAGICTHNLTKDNIDTVLHTAIKAAYEASTKDIYLLTQDDISSNLNTSDKDRIYTALAVDEFELFLQPIISLKEERIIGFEGLVRWNSPERGLLMPGEFISHLETGRLREKFEHWTLSSAHKILSTLEYFNLTSVWLSVNLNLADGINIRTSEVAESIFGESPELRKRLVLEVTERISMLAKYEKELNKLRSLGINIAIDDFGTGYSSLSRINELPLNKIKIDRSFIRQMRQSKKAAILVDIISSLAARLELSVVAEGIENLEDLDHMKQANVNEIQGFIFSEAKPLTHWLNILPNDKEWVRDRLKLAK